MPTPEARAAGIAAATELADEIRLMRGEVHNLADAQRESRASQKRWQRVIMLIAGMVVVLVALAVATIVIGVQVHNQSACNRAYIDQATSRSKALYGLQQDKDRAAAEYTIANRPGLAPGDAQVTAKYNAYVLAYNAYNNALNAHPPINVPQYNC